MARNFIVIFVLSMIFCSTGHSAVESIGEVNAKDNSTGEVVAGYPANLVVSIIIDMSQAEPGEEIEAIRIYLPNGLSAQERAVNSVTVAGKNVVGFTESKPDKSTIIVTLPTVITQTSAVSIDISVDVSPIPDQQLSIIVSLIAINNRLLIASIKPGNADGRVNNDNLTIKTVSATKPQPPTNVKVMPDPQGENDLIITWSKPEDTGIIGYLIYRSDRGEEPIADVRGADQTTYVDRNLNPGRYSYVVRSYKTALILRSEPSEEVSAIATPDKRAPEPPVIIPETKLVEKGVQISWELSPSEDVEKYIIYRGTKINAMTKIDEVDKTKSSFIDTNPPKTGSYIYIVSAVDEAGNEAKSSPTQPRGAIFGDRPQPNPFAPLSNNPQINKVTFPITIIKDAEGTPELKIFDLEGNLVFEKQAESGAREIKWDGKDNNGRIVNSGVYVYQFSVGEKYKIGTVIVAK